MQLRRLVVAAFVALLVFALVVSMIGAAGAHGPVGEAAVEVTSDPDDPTQLTIRARIVYADDGHPVEDDAVVRYVVGGDPEDIAHDSGDMPRVGEGQYEVQATVPGPGSYSVAVVSENPEARAETGHTVEEAAPTPTTAPPDDDEADDPDDGSVTLSWPVVIAIGVFLGLVGGVVVVAARQRRM